jgi:hypothetical protein
VAKESEVLRSVQATLTSADPAALVQHAALPDLNKVHQEHNTRALRVAVNTVCSRSERPAIMMGNAAAGGSPLHLSLVDTCTGRHPSY